MKITDYKILPKRNGKVDSAFRDNWKPVKFCTNYYDISIDSKKSKIYQYSFALPQDIPQDSGLYSHALASIKKTLREKVGYIAVSKQVVWGTIQLKVPTSFQCKFKADDNDYNLEALLKPTKTLDIRDLDSQQTRPIYLQILNMNLKNTLKSIKLSELGKKGQYFEKKFVKANGLAEIGLEVLQGFRFTLTPLNSGIYLQVDVCSRVLQSRNLLQIFNGKGKDINKGRFQGTVVISKYGTYRTYRIQQIDYNMTPMSKFYNQKKGKQTTYQQYYKEAYGINIGNIKQPLLKAIKSRRRELVKGGKQYKQVEQIVYLIPQLVSPTGMTDDQRADRETMKILAPYTKLTPNKRIEQCSYVIEDINNAMGLIEIKQPKKLQGYCLPKPYLFYSGQTFIQPDNRGNIKHRGVLREAFNFTDWIFLYSGKLNGSKNDGEAEDAFHLLKKSAESYGVSFKNPGFIIVQSGHVQDWQKQIQMDTKKNGTPQIIVVFLERHEQKLYAELKRFITNTIQCPSQFIRKQTLLSPKGAMSAASKIIIQMNIKVGKVPWYVQKGHPYFKDKKMMYGAISISKGSKGNTLAFVGTLNSQCTRVFSDCRVGIKDKQNIPVDYFEEIFISWAKAYYQHNKAVPDLILLYREGLSIPQIRAQLPMMEIPALERMIKKIGDKTKVKDYNPQLMIVTANKKISTRYFSYSQENRMNSNKFIPNLQNPDSGSVMIQSLSSDDMYDFHLAAQYVTQGTCTPTLFRVAYDKSRMPQEALINFTFEQCFNYYNWEGAVRVPACLQCADKLSKLVGQYIKEDIVVSSLNKKHFFL